MALVRELYPSRDKPGEVPVWDVVRRAAEQGIDGHGSFSGPALGRLQVAPGKREDIFRSAPRRHSVL